MKERRIRVTAGEVRVTAVLNDSRTADLLWSALPVSAIVSTWGQEVYFPTPVQMPEDGAREVVDVGAVAYWPPGQALCLFFGPTPASRGDEVRPASPVNVLGSIEGDPKVLRRVASGTSVAVERA